MKLKDDVWPQITDESACELRRIRRSRNRAPLDVQRRYIRINPTEPEAPDPHADPNTTMLAIANGGGVHPARSVVGGDFLHLVRLGIRAADDPIVWSANHWASTNKMDATPVSALNLWFADLLTKGCPEGSVIQFTFFWKEAQRWEGRNYSVAVSGPK